MSISKRMRMAAALAIAAVGGVGGSQLLTLAQADDPPPAPPTSTEPVPATHDQKTAFAVLDRAPSTADTANNLVTALADAAQRGFAPADARVVGSTGAGPIWLVPANGALCLALQATGDGSLGASCEPSEAVITRGIAVGDGTTVYGLAPDGVTSVDVTDDGNATTTVDLVPGDSIYRLDTGHVTVTVDGSGGMKSFDVAGG
jgi:hypothetical protein